MGTNVKKKIERRPNPCYGAPLEKRAYPSQRWALRLPFTPSNAQLTRYAEFHRHKVPMNWENTPPTPRFDDDALRDLRARYPEDPLYKLISRYRKIEKVLSTEIDGVAIGADGRVHTEFGHKPRTLRLSSRNPNMQNKDRGDDPLSPGAQVKKMYVAGPGKVFLSRDYSGIEAVITGYLAHSRRLVQVAGGEIQDVHGMIATTAVGDPPDMTWTDTQIAAHLKKYKKSPDQEFRIEGKTMRYGVLRTGCKRAFYLSCYGGTPNKMVQAEPDIFPDRKTAGWYQEMVFATFPEIRPWQWAVCEEADRLGYIRTNDGFRQHFYDVFTYSHSKAEKRWIKKFGETAKEAIAAKPQHLAMLFMARALIALWEEQPEIAQGLRLTIHDDITGEWDEDRIGEIDAVLREVMERPNPFLPLPADWGMGTHLAIRTDRKIGRVWGEMH